MSANLMHNETQLFTLKYSFMSKGKHGLHYSILRKLLARQTNDPSRIADKTIRVAYDRLFGDGRPDLRFAGKELSDAVNYLEEIAAMEKIRNIGELDRYFEQFDRQTTAYVEKYEKADALDRIALEYDRPSADSMICCPRDNNLQQIGHASRQLTM
jgi:hypothetical protein